MPLPARDPLDHPEEAIRRVYAYVAYRIGTGPQAEDVTAAAIERAIRYRSTYRPDLGSRAAWLFSIARRCVAEVPASQPDDGPSGPEVESDHGGDTSQTAEHVELRRTVAMLDTRSQDLVALRYGAGLSSREIGQIYEMSAGAVNVALDRALNEIPATRPER